MAKINGKNTMKAKQVLYLGLILPVLFLSACSSTPSKEEARKALARELDYEEKQDRILGLGDGVEESIKIVSFEKIHEQSGEMLGIEIYNLKFKAKLAFPEGWNTECISAEGEDSLSCGRKTVLEPGERKTIKGNIYSEKTSEGWKNWDVQELDLFGP